MITITGSLEKSTTNPAPQIEVYLPDWEKATGAAIVIFPGGGYWFRAGHEGKDYAEHFQKHGFACFVVDYRSAEQGHRHPAMLEDGLSAIHAVRSRASEFQINPAMIGVMGSSAGGHLAAHTMVAYDKRESSVPLRPDFGILCYPNITMDLPVAHQGCRNNLLGENPPQALVDETSCEKNVTAKTPPCFIWHTWEDDGVPVQHSILFASALNAAKVPFELHVYQKGAHGLGLNAEFPWARECLRWLETITHNRGRK